MGANDCFLLTSPRVFKKELECLIQQIQMATGAEWIYLAAIPPVHLFPAFSEQMRSFLYRQRNYLLHEMEAIAAQKPQVIFHQIPMDLQPNSLCRWSPPFRFGLSKNCRIGHRKDEDLTFLDLSLVRSFDIFKQLRVPSLTVFTHQRLF